MDKQKHQRNSDGRPCDIFLRFFGDSSCCKLVMNNLSAGGNNNNLLLVLVLINAINGKKNQMQLRFAYAKCMCLITGQKLSRMCN